MKQHKTNKPTIKKIRKIYCPICDKITLHKHYKTTKDSIKVYRCKMYKKHKQQKGKNDFKKWFLGWEQHIKREAKRK